MMFRVAVVALLASTVSAFIPSGDVAADSPLGLRMLNSATVVEPARHLADQNERDTTFIASYSLRYLGCASLIQIAEEQGNNNNNGGGMLRTQHLVRFALCPTDSCSSCKGGGEYIVNMMDFVDSYTEAKLNAQEYTCEMIRENCYCDNANDDQVCENQCYTDEGHTECIEYEGEENFEIQRYLECQQMEGNNNNNNNGDNVAYYVGPYCASDGKSIHLGVFSDQYCTAKAEGGLDAWKTNNYGASLPYSSESMVKSECMDCTAADNNNNNNNNNGNVEITELCDESYQMAARCEEKMEIQYPDTSGCDYINNILPRLEYASRSISTKSSQGKGAKAFAGIFAFTTVLFAAYAYFLYRKIKRGSVDLSAQE